MSLSLNGGILPWILIGAVIISLGLSVATMIVQISKNRASSRQPPAKPPSQPWGMPVAPPQYESPAAQQPPPQVQSWRPPAPPHMHEDSNRTEPLFASKARQYASDNSSYAQAQAGAFRMFIRESSPDGERNHEVTVNGELPVGRSASSGLCINHQTVSGLQCVFIAGPDSVFVSNKSGSNITRLNGAKLDDTRPLKPGDTLGLGNVQLSIVDIRKNAAY